MPELMTEEAFALKLNDLEDASFVYEQSQGTVSCERMREKLRAARAVVLAAYSAALAAQPAPRVTALVEACEGLLVAVTELHRFVPEIDLNGYTAINQAREALAAAKGEPAAERLWTQSEERMPPAGKLCHVRRGKTRLHDARYDRGLWIYEADDESGRLTSGAVVGTEWRPIPTS